jgi:hypothetical protein
MVDQQPAHEQAAARADARDGGDQAQRAGAPVAGKGVADDAEAQREDPAADALDDAGRRRASHSADRCHIRAGVSVKEV